MTYLSIHFFYLSTSLSTYLSSTHLSLSLSPPVRPIHPSFRLSILVTIYIPTSLSIYLSMYLSIYLSVCVAVCLFMYKKPDKRNKRESSKPKKHKFRPNLGPATALHSLTGLLQLRTGKGHRLCRDFSLKGSGV